MQDQRRTPNRLCVRQLHGSFDHGDPGGKPRLSGVSAPPPATGSSHATVPEPAGDSCPLCASPLHPDQEWCLHCGAAARTRLAPSSNSKAPMVAVAVVAGLSLAVLAAALVKLAGDTGSPTSSVASSVTAAASV